MIATGTATVAAARLAGTRTIVRFNWPKYVVVVVLAAGAAVAARLGVATAVLAPVVVAAGLGLLWSVTSLLATWWVYDRTDLYAQIGAGLGPVGSWIVVHAGFDESTGPLTRSIGHPPAAVVALDTRARRGLRHARRAQQAPALVASARRVPVPSGSADAVFVSLSAHEVRAVADQQALFAELRRVLAPGGRLVVTEHLRDLPNAAVYGPAALHFQRGRTWIDRAGEQGLVPVGAVPITPFVRRFVWRRDEATRRGGAPPPRPAARPAGTSHPRRS